jgi:hypothetical protein
MTIRKDPPSLLSSPAAKYSSVRPSASIVKKEGNYASAVALFAQALHARRKAFGSSYKERLRKEYLHVH